MSISSVWLSSLAGQPLVARGAAIASLGLTLIVLLVIYRIFLHPLSRIPGPFLARISNNWKTSKYRQGQWHEDIVKLHETYGRVVRIAPNEISVVDEYAMKQLYGHGHNAAKTDWYRIWNPPGMTSIFSETDKSYHSFLRKRVSQAYSMSSMLKYETYIQRCLDLLLHRLWDMARSPIDIDIASWTNALAFDVVGELAYGQELGHIRTGTDVHGLRNTIYGAFVWLSSNGDNTLAKWLLNQKKLAKIMPNPFGSFLTWSTDVVTARMTGKDNVERDDMLNHFCRMKTADGKAASLDDVLIEAMNLVGAGADTTSIGMKANLYYLAKNPRHYKLLQAEVDAYYKDNQLSEPIKYLQTQQLPMLQAIVKESTRLLPSIVFQLPRVAPPNFTIRDYHIPPGTSVGISPIAQNRDKEIWGPDANDFRPERWLEDEARARYLDSSNMTFGGNGPRTCIGKNIALVEMHKFIAQFIHHFDFELVNPDKPWRITSHWFAMQHEFGLRVMRREHALPRSVRSPYTAPMR
ncbi:cytochrome P450 [Elsinoe ampelina]|uniref:Cytochrome P450 n=1 Tax=Elsinoe ampelina TaxID=302913 RepID=A0A6A6GQP4_9PEZI|nr:cytochrome P450 [Elsinoe ampelina]